MIFLPLLLVYFGTLIGELKRFLDPDKIEYQTMRVVMSGNAKALRSSGFPLDKLPPELKERYLLFYQEQMDYLEQGDSKVLSLYC